MATRAPQPSTIEGVTLTFHAAAAGDKISGVTRPLNLIVDNASCASVDLTIDPPGNNSYGVANPAKVIAVAAGTREVIKLLPEYRDPADSFLISLAWSATTSVTFAVVS